jgi:hypothetical protein
MARWSPPDKIAKNERIGRRLFAEPMLSGAIDQRPFAGLLLTHFEETRSSEYSLDRLGATGADRRVLAYLQPRADAAGRTFGKPKTFDGWATLPAKELSSARKKPDLPVVPSPIPEEGDENDIKGNRYHAHVCRPDDMDPDHMAHHLRHLFTSYGSIEVARRTDRDKGNWMMRAFAFMRDLFGKAGVL